MKKDLDMPMFMMVMANEIMDYVLNIDKEIGFLYIEEEYIDVVNARLMGFGIFNQVDTVNLKNILGDNYNQEYINYLFDDVWVGNDCI